MSVFLELDRVNAFYGASHAVQDVSLALDAGEVVLLLGRNGAGKTTLMRTIMGLVETRGDGLRFRGQELIGMPPHRIARLGIGLVPEDRRMFAKLTVRENLEVGRKAPPEESAGGRWDLERVFELFPRLQERQHQRAGALSGGEQQMLAIARTLMGNPMLLLLDEPAEGLAPVIAQALAAQLARLRSEGLSMLISEQNLSFARSLADRAYVMESGRVRYQGSLNELDANPAAWTRYVAF